MSLEERAMKYASILFTVLAICGLIYSVTLHALVQVGAVPVFLSSIRSETAAYWSVVCACLAVVFRPQVQR